MSEGVVDQVRHLTWRGRYEAAVDALWRGFHRPVDPSARCFMGAPLGGIAQCPRPAVGGGLWCRRHNEPEEPTE